MPNDTPPDVTATNGGCVYLFQIIQYSPKANQIYPRMHQDPFDRWSVDRILPKQVVGG